MPLSVILPAFLEADESCLTQVVMLLSSICYVEIEFLKIGYIVVLSFPFR